MDVRPRGGIKHCSVFHPHHQHAFTEHVLGVHGARPVAAIIEIKHYGMAGYKGEYVAMVTDGTVTQKSYDHVHAHPSALRGSLGTLPNGKMVVYQFKATDFEDFAHNAGHGADAGDVPAIHFGYEMAGFPINAHAESVAFKYRCILLAYVQKKEVATHHNNIPGLAVPTHHTSENRLGRRVERDSGKDLSLAGRERSTDIEHHSTPLH